MAGYNRGEWSETLAVLSLLENSCLQIVDRNLRPICEDTFEVKQIVKPPESKINYYIADINDISKASRESFIKNMALVSKAKNATYEAILKAPKGRGSFVIESLKGLNLPVKMKSKNSSKSDLTAVIFDKRTGKERRLGFSIKSMLGSPATILNASIATNFKYIVYGLNEVQVKEINETESRKTLIDRISMIDSAGGVIHPLLATNPIFKENLRRIDPLLEHLLADLLLQSYRASSKDILQLLENLSFGLSYKKARELVSRLLIAVSLGMVPDTLWDGELDANGGILVVKDDGKVVLLDAIYHSEDLVEFLINETRLDTPSRTRYHMLELRPEENKSTYSFTLNLQIRLKH